MRRQHSSKSNTCTESFDVNAAGISGKVSAQYPGRSAILPCASDTVSQRLAPHKHIFFSLLGAILLSAHALSPAQRQTKDLSRKGRDRYHIGN